MRKVEIYKYKRLDGKLVRIKTGEIGYFHQFGCEYTEFESGVGNFTTAVIELPNGMIKSIRAELITFIQSEET